MIKALKGIIHEVRYKFSYAYRIEIGVGLSAIRNDRELKAVIKFCKNELADNKAMTRNPKRKKIFGMTIILYEQGLSKDKDVFTKCHEFNDKQYNDVHEFIDNYLTWYWN
jgi:hypothetical protein